MAKAATIMRKHGTPINTEEGAGLHVSLEYLCCQTKDDAHKVQELYKQMQFPRLNVSFDRAVCRTDYDDGASGMHASVIVLLDSASNAKMEAFVSRVENAIAAAGVNLTIRRRDQQPFHSSLGSVHIAKPNAIAETNSSYPIAEALADITNQIKPGAWHAEPIIIQNVTYGW
jgi:hypothetical protein